MGLFNNLMTQISNSHECGNKYEDIFQTCERPGNSIFKTKIIQELVQIERPKNWNREKLLTIVMELKNMEYAYLGQLKILTQDGSTFKIFN